MSGDFESLWCVKQADSIKLFRGKTGVHVEP